MKYMGSKAKYAKYILPIILKDRKPNQFYVEPFCGGCNIIDKVNGNRIGNDINFHIIEMFKAIQNDWSPPNSISEQEYKFMRGNPSGFNPALIGFVSVGCSYSGKVWGGFARGNDNNGNARNYCLESKKNLLNQKEGLKNVMFSNLNYYDMIIPDNSIIYADKPYENSTEYKNKFDHKRFWIWAKEMANKGHKVFVSEYNAPENWKCVWQKEVFSSLTKETGSKTAIEKLFTIDN